MINDNHQEWYEANQRHLMASIECLRLKLMRQANFGHQKPYTKSRETRVTKALKAAEKALPAPAAMETLCQAFNLSEFERNLLLLCAAVELDDEFAALCAMVHNDDRRDYPSFGLAMKVFEHEDRGPLAPAASLRHWFFIESEPTPTLTCGRLRIDERILNYLTGIDFLDRRLAGLVSTVSGQSNLVPSHRLQAEKIATVWQQMGDFADFPIVQLYGPDAEEKQAVAAQACEWTGLTMARLSARNIPENITELDAFVRLWSRETVLSHLALLVDCDDIDTADSVPAHLVRQLLERIHGPVVVSTRSSWQPAQRTTITMEIQKPSAVEQYDLWISELKGVKGWRKSMIRSLVSQFNLSAGIIESICSEAYHYNNVKTEDKSILSRNARKQPDRQKQPASAGRLDDRLWHVCRFKTRPRLGSLAQSIKPLATWKDMVLPDIQTSTLQEIAIHVRQRLKVYEQWGFSAKSERGLGISALFSGSTGTGKTMAAEVLANDLRLDLYRIDLSQVVSKYIGETEKNLARVFDEAEAGGVILLFDEADALFGKRSEVKDSHDRYANIEISYLLQRMEAYRGLAILTTNMKAAIDNAFLRRIRFVVHFPFPDAAMRADIWRRIFPAKKITADLDIDKLSRLNIAGGNIRNISLNAAFLAADGGVKIRMDHILRAARSEYAKMEKPLSDAETRDWDS
jgi:hypothetical protein